MRQREKDGETERGRADDYDNGISPSGPSAAMSFDTMQPCVLIVAVEDEGFEGF